MGKYKRKFGFYSAWNYELEIEDLNKMSEQGWQLIRGGGLFSNKFKKNPDIQYRYQLDFQPSIEDKGRYIETFREQGWEYVNSTFNGWHYFRKLYDESRPEEEYEIFTDVSSAKEMNNRWVIAGMVCLAFLFVYFAMQVVRMILWPQIPTLFGIIHLGVIFAVILRGILVMRKTEGNRKSRFDKWLMPVFFAWVIFGAVVTVSLVEARPRYIFMNMVAEYYAAIPKEREEAWEWTVFEVDYPDNYYLDLMIDAETPICVSFVDENGDVVYTVTTTKFEEENIRLLLPKGMYSMCFSDFAGGRLSASAAIE